MRGKGETGREKSVTGGEEMIQFKHTITDPNGLHARNALLLSREISGYTSVVEVQCGSKWASGRQVMALMGLGARCGEEVQFFVDGQDEATAAAGIRKFIEKYL